MSTNGLPVGGSRPGGMQTRSARQFGDFPGRVIPETPGYAVEPRGPSAGYVVSAYPGERPGLRAGGSAHPVQNRAGGRSGQPLVPGIYPNGGSVQ